MIDSTPVERSTTVDIVNPNDKQTERSKPSSAHQQVEGVVHEGVGEWQQPDKAHEQRNAGNDGRVDDACNWAAVVLPMQVNKPCRETQHNLLAMFSIRGSEWRVQLGGTYASADKLCESEEERQEAGEDHGC